MLNMSANYWEGRLGLFPEGGCGGMLPHKILNFSSCRDVFSCFLMPKAMFFNHRKITPYLDNLMI